MSRNSISSQLVFNNISYSLLENTQVGIQPFNELLSENVPKKYGSWNETVFKCVSREGAAEKIPLHTDTDTDIDTHTHTHTHTHAQTHRPKRSAWKEAIKG